MQKFFPFYHTIQLSVRITQNNIDLYSLPFLLSNFKQCVKYKHHVYLVGVVGVLGVEVEEGARNQ